MWTVPVAKYTLWLGTVLRHDHARHNVQKPENSEQQLPPKHSVISGRFNITTREQKDASSRDVQQRRRLSTR